MPNPDDGTVPEIVPRKPDVVRVWHWSVTPKTAVAIRIAGVVPALGFAGWLLQNFLQLRGVVDVLASRIDLAFLWLALFAAGWVATVAVHRRVATRVVIGICALLAVIGLDSWAPKPIRSFVYIAPGISGFYMKAGSVQRMWQFFVMHRGQEPSYHIEILFVDEVKQKQVVTAKRTLTSIDVNSYQLLLRYPEIDAHGRGSLFATQFMWIPPDADHECYHILLTWRGGSVIENLGIERVNGKWFWAVNVKDRETGKLLIDCKDLGFPFGDRRPQGCFPGIINDN